MAVTSDGSVYTWGDNDSFQLGIGDLGGRFLPGLVPDLEVMDMVSAGRWQSLALAADGTGWAWGLNGEGQLGDGTTVEKSIPAQMLTPSGTIVLEAGGYHGLAVVS